MQRILLIVIPFLTFSHCSVTQKNNLLTTAIKKSVSINQTASPKIQQTARLPYKNPIGPQRNQFEWGILLGGDVMLDWGVRDLMQNQGEEAPGYFVKPLSDLYDFSIVNLETPIVKKCHYVKNKLYTFQADLRQLRLLSFLKVHAVSVANNHIGDCGPEGMTETLKHLAKQGIHAGGIGTLEPVHKRNHIHIEHQNRTITILVYAIKSIPKDRATSQKMGVYYPTPELIAKDIAFWRPKSDHLMVSVHWGTEYYDRPLPEQKKLARGMIDQGADIVFGHHSHWVQGIELYKQGAILYSLGNFIFGSTNKFLRNGYLAGLIFRGEQLSRIELYPIKTQNIGKNRFQPRPLTGKKNLKVLRQVLYLSKEFGTSLTIKNEIGIISPKPANDYYRLNHHFRWMMEVNARRQGQLKLH